jgi:8-oxo-dGTP pyrophosphatase MutT (NUDIX family)
MAESPEVRDTGASYPVSDSVEHFSGPVISVRTDVVQMPDGETAKRDYAMHPGAVGVIALDAQDRVLLLQQYRHPPRRLLWEPPAGILDVDGEPPLDTAKRELHEEAACIAAEWWLLADLLTSPGMSDEALRIYLARGLTSVADADRYVGIHEEADMPIEWVPLDDAVTKVLAGELHNPTAVVGVLAASAARERGWVDLRPADTPWPERPGDGGTKA